MIDCDPSIADCGNSHSPNLCDLAECLDFNPCDFDWGKRKKRSSTNPSRKSSSPPAARQV